MFRFALFTALFAALPGMAADDAYPQMQQFIEPATLTHGEQVGIFRCWRVEDATCSTVDGMTGCVVLIEQARRKPHRCLGGLLRKPRVNGSRLNENVQYLSAFI